MGNGIGIERVTQVTLGTAFQMLWEGSGSPRRRQFDRRPRAQKTPYAERAKPRIRVETSGQRALRGIFSRCVNRRVSRKNGSGERCVSVGFMARRWMSVRVELLGGRGEQLWPYPGRVFAVGPAHTFADLARAIDNAFARWDLSHLSVFTLADGRVVTDAETGGELATSALGVMPTAALDIEVTKVMQTVKTGAQFRYVFDLGDDWTHCCTVDAGNIDPADVLGVIPPAPMAYWGWGTIPDQYDRGWAEDDGAARAPSRPRQPHAMLDGRWPGSGERPPWSTLTSCELRRRPATWRVSSRRLRAMTSRRFYSVRDRRFRWRFALTSNGSSHWPSPWFSGCRYATCPATRNWPRTCSPRFRGSRRPASCCSLTSNSCRD